MLIGRRSDGGVLGGAPLSTLALHQVDKIMVLDDSDTIAAENIPRLPVYILLGLPDRLSYPFHSIRGKQLALVICKASQVILALWGTSRSPE